MTQQTHKSVTQNTTQPLTVSGWLVRIFLYGCASCCFLLLDTSFGNTNPDTEAWHRMNSFNKRNLDQIWLSETFPGGDAGIPSETRNYHYRLLSRMAPVQFRPKLNPSPDAPSMIVAIAQAKRSSLPNYIGAVAAVSSYPVIPEIKTMNRVVCKMTETNALPAAMPSLLENRLLCPPGSIPR